MRGRNSEKAPAAALAGSVPTNAAADFRLFILASVLIGLGSCINSAAFNNYLSDQYALGVAERTFLEFPREMPGLLASLFMGMLAAIGDIRIAAVACATASAGMFALGWIPSVYWIMLLSTFVYSCGAHLYLPLGNSIGMSFAKSGKEGTVLGRIQSVSTVAVVAGTGVLLLLFRFGGLSYRMAFGTGAGFYLAAALALFCMQPRRDNARHGRFVFRKRYSRYYMLCLLYGARKQLFMTFGPWMLVDLFRQPVSTMTFLFFLVSVVNIFAKPLIGRLTDRYGPGAMLRTEALLTIVLCLLYAFSPAMLSRSAALVVLSLCYICDQASDAFTMSRAIYAKSVVADPAELSATLTAGISIDHVVAMSLPAIGGLLWRSGGAYGYRWIFLGGAAVAVGSFFIARGIPSPAGIRSQDS